MGSIVLRHIGMTTGVPAGWDLHVQGGLFADSRFAEGHPPGSLGAPGRRRAAIYARGRVEWAYCA